MNNRLELITSYLENENKITVKELSERLNVSEKTIRLDLNRLENSGVLLRTHGGAVISSSSYNNPFFDLDGFHNNSPKEKQEIARKAVNLIMPYSVICLDDGSTTFEIARLLGEFPITVITHDLKIITELAQKPNVDVLVIGGFINRNNNGQMIISGEESVKMIKKYSANTAFIGASCISEDGLSLFKRGEKDIKKAYISISDKSYCVVDSSKFGHKAITKLSSPSELPDIICDSSLEPDVKEKYSNLGYRII